MTQMQFSKCTRALLFRIASVEWMEHCCKSNKPFSIRSHHINSNCLSFKCAYECLCVSGCWITCIYGVKRLQFRTFTIQTRLGLPQHEREKRRSLHGDHEAIKFSANIVIKYISSENLCGYVCALFIAYTRSNLLNRITDEKKTFSQKVVAWIWQFSRQE